MSCLVRSGATSDPVENEEDELKNYGNQEDNDEEMENRSVVGAGGPNDLMSGDRSDVDVMADLKTSLVQETNAATSCNDLDVRITLHPSPLHPNTSLLPQIPFALLCLQKKILLEALLGYPGRAIFEVLQNFASFRQKFAKPQKFCKFQTKICETSKICVKN